MKRTWKGATYETQLTSDNSDGWVALELQRAGVLVARVVFWDAEGQFSLELSIGELPLAIVEELIAEAKSKIKVA
jgi:hypothetical protein